MGLSKIDNKLNALIKTTDKAKAKAEAKAVASQHKGRGVAASSTKSKYSTIEDITENQDANTLYDREVHSLTHGIESKLTLFKDQLSETHEKKCLKYVADILNNVYNMDNDMIKNCYDHISQSIEECKNMSPAAQYKIHSQVKSQFENAICKKAKYILQGHDSSAIANAVKTLQCCPGIDIKNTSLMSKLAKKYVDNLQFVFSTQVDYDMRKQVLDEHAAITDKTCQLISILSGSSTTALKESAKHNKLIERSHKKYSDLLAASVADTKTLIDHTISSSKSASDSLNSLSKKMDKLALAYNEYTNYEKKLNNKSQSNLQKLGSNVKEAIDRVKNWFHLQLLKFDVFSLSLTAKNLDVDLNIVKHSTETLIAVKDKGMLTSDEIKTTDSASLTSKLYPFKFLDFDDSKIAECSATEGEDKIANLFDNLLNSKLVVNKGIGLFCLKKALDNQQSIDGASIAKNFFTELTTAYEYMGINHKKINVAIDAIKADLDSNNISDINSIIEVQSDAIKKQIDDLSISNRIKNWFKHNKGKYVPLVEENQDLTNVSLSAPDDIINKIDSYLL